MKCDGEGLGDLVTCDDVGKTDGRHMGGDGGGGGGKHLKTVWGGGGGIISF